MQKYAVILVVAVLFVGCAGGEKNAQKDQALESEGRGHGEHAHDKHGHGEHAHGEHEHGHGKRFHKPEDFAEKWNSAERDEKQKPGEIVAAMGLQAGMTTADLGAGTGYLLPHLSKAVGESGVVYALDAEDAMIDYLGGQVAQMGPARIEVQKVPWDAPGLEDATLDAMVTLNTWHHVQGREAYARKVAATLKPGGRFVVVEFTMEATYGPPAKMKLEPAQVIADLEAGGFTAELVEETMPDHYMVVGKKAE